MKLTTLHVYLAYFNVLVHSGGIRCAKRLAMFSNMSAMFFRTPTIPPTTRKMGILGSLGQSSMNTIPEAEGDGR